MGNALLDPSCSDADVKCLREQLRESPALARVGPFALFLLLTFFQGKLGATSPYWVYLAKTVLGGWMIWLIRPLVSEMRWQVSWEAVGVGVAVFAVWVGLDGFYPVLKWSGTAWNPSHQFGDESRLAWFFIAVRILGSSLVVPPLEEVFYRSFFYRALANRDFEKVPLGYFAWMPFLVTSLVFGLQHREWLAGILCGFAYQGLVLRRQRLGDAITAHAITNLLLGLWVVGKGAWQFW